MSALAAYESGLRAGGGCWITTDTGNPVEMPVGRWLGAADASDATLLNLCAGPTLDVGCGPGRLTLALAQRGVHALGIDVSTEALRMAAERGARVQRCDVFGAVPSAGAWHHLLLADGNIGIGGTPVRLLRRARDLMTLGGSIIADLEPPGNGVMRRRIELEAHGHRGSVPWAHVGIDAIAAVAGGAGLCVKQLISSETGRHVAELSRRGGQ